MKRKSIYLALATISLIALAGCGKKQVDYNVTETPGGAEITEAVDNPEATESDIPETLNYELVGKMSTIRVNATVKLPDKYTQCSVVELGKKSYEDADIKYYADKIFDKGSYFLYMPYSAEQIAYCRDKLNEILEGTDDEELRHVIEDGYLINIGFRESYLTGDEEIDGTLKFNTVRPYPEDADIQEFTNMCQLIGTIDGQYYMLVFEKNDINYHMYLHRSEDYSIQEVGAESFDMKLTGNLCEYTQEEAEKLARDYVEMLGYGDLSIVKSINAEKAYYTVENATGEKNYAQEIQGYNIYFGRKYGGYSVTYTDDNYWGYQGFGQYSTFDGDPEWITITDMKEFIRVYVDNNGICEVDIVNPLVEESIATENAILLDFDSMIQAANAELQSYADEYRNSFIIEEIELGYGIEQKDGKTSLVPTWYFFDNSYGEDRQIYFRHPSLMINALDGSVLYRY